MALAYTAPFECMLELAPSMIRTMLIMYSLLDRLESLLLSLVLLRAPVLTIKITLLGCRGSRARILTDILGRGAALMGSRVMNGKRT